MEKSITIKLTERELDLIAFALNTKVIEHKRNIEDLKTPEDKELFTDMYQSYVDEYTNLQIKFIDERYNEFLPECK